MNRMRIENWTLSIGQIWKKSDQCSVPNSQFSSEEKKKPGNTPSGAGLLLLVVLALIPPLFAQKQTLPRFDRELSKKEQQWVKQTLAGLSLDQKIGQMIIVNTNAVFMNRESDEYKQLRHYVVDDNIGGFILSRSDVWATAMLTNRLQEMATVPLLISADLERGPGMRLDDTTWWASNMGVAATGDPGYAKLQGNYTAREARAAGINWLFAPVADVNNNPENPVINTRSYGEDPQTVARFASAFIEGVQGAGALATAKHFPGHGDTATDSHLGLPIVDVSRQRLDQLELIPFRAAIASRVGSIMPAPIALPQMETDPTLPATLSRTILTGLLRDEMSFKGIAVTDAMQMAGVASRYSPAAAAVLAVKAGADMILKTPDTDAVIRGIKQAVGRGEIAEARINASVERILRAKAALSLVENRIVNIASVDGVVSDPQFNSVAQEIADRSITLVRDERKYVPVSKGASLVVVFTDDENRTVAQPFIADLGRSGMQVETVVFDIRSTEVELEQLHEKLEMQNPAV